MGLNAWLAGPPPFQVELVGWSSVATVVTLAAAATAIVKTLALSRLFPALRGTSDRRRSLAPVVIASVVGEAALLVLSLHIGRDHDMASFVTAWFIAAGVVNGLAVARGGFAPSSAWRRIVATGVAWAIYPAMLGVMGLTLYEAVMSVFIRVFP